MTVSFSGLELPDELRGAVERHQNNIAELVVRLRAAGMQQTLIEQSVDQLLASYRSELVRAMDCLGSVQNA